MDSSGSRILNGSCGKWTDGWGSRQIGRISPALHGDLKTLLRRRLMMKRCFAAAEE